MLDPAPLNLKSRRSRSLAVRLEDAREIEEKAAAKLAQAEARRQAAADRLARKVRQRQKYEAVAKTRERKLDTRRKVIAGALALEHCRHDPMFAATLRALLDEYVTRDEERALFGLEALPAAIAAETVDPASRAA